MDWEIEFLDQARDDLKALKLSVPEENLVHGYLNERRFSLRHPCDVGVPLGDFWLYHTRGIDITVAIMKAVEGKSRATIYVVAFKRPK